MYNFNNSINNNNNTNNNNNDNNNNNNDQQNQPQPQPQPQSINQPPRFEHVHPAAFGMFPPPSLHHFQQQQHLQQQGIVPHPLPPPPPSPSQIYYNPDDDPATRTPPFPIIPPFVPPPVYHPPPPTLLAFPFPAPQYFGSNHSGINTIDNLDNDQFGFSYPDSPPTTTSTTSTPLPARNLKRKKKSAKKHPVSSNLGEVRQRERDIGRVSAGPIKRKKVEPRRPRPRPPSPPPPPSQPLPPPPPPPIQQQQQQQIPRGRIGKNLILRLLKDRESAINNTRYSLECRTVLGSLPSVIFPQQRVPSTNNGDPKSDDDNRSCVATPQADYVPSSREIQDILDRTYPDGPIIYTDDEEEEEEDYTDTSFPDSSSPPTLYVEITGPSESNGQEEEEEEEEVTTTTTTNTTITPFTNTDLLTVEQQDTTIAPFTNATMDVGQAIDTTLPLLTFTDNTAMTAATGQVAGIGTIPNIEIQYYDAEFLHRMSTFLGMVPPSSPSSPYP
ncbi:hypothetical protein DFA_06800 [Cavenderia fasciculata]|uniref:Uncharacterized protein n=1 Tax=Cavenderia fasciculata TaxID=261658 RepID=F4Q2B3_CACFS|nr:uncharacterized protein DFA_06800 [Cavenderia fasciculata]EGG18133.1 hypothetical protein DFA_06800 [Cavenderia fasciculata]|eukprot:XP_004366174.1 hypothetical protein DFA_06800 [Cavenderia fasciculata]